MDGFLEKLEFETRSELDLLPPINSIEELRTFCSNIENKLMQFLIIYTYKYANFLFKNVVSNEKSDYIVDKNGLCYKVHLAPDLSTESRLNIGIYIIRPRNSTKTFNIEFRYNSTGRYKSFSIVLSQELLLEKNNIIDFYKTIVSTVYSYFKEHVLLYVSESRKNFAKQLYAYSRSLFSNQELLDNFWYAIVGQGYGFRLFDSELTNSAFDIIEGNISDYDSYTNLLVTELLGTKLPTEKMLMSIAIQYKQTLIAELKKALYTAEGSIYSTTLYSLYGSENFVIWPIYIDDYSVLALYPVDSKKAIENTIMPHIDILRKIISDNINILIQAYELFSDDYQSEENYPTKLSKCIKKILRMLYQADIESIPPDIGINLSKHFKTHYDYDSGIFSDAMEALKINCYILQCADSNYRITEKGKTFFSGIDNMKNEKISQSIVFNGEVKGCTFADTISGGYTMNNGIDYTSFNEIIKQIKQVAYKEDLYNQEIILKEIEKINKEVHKESPSKKVINEAIDWLSKISSLTGLIIKLSGLITTFIK